MFVKSMSMARINHEKIIFFVVVTYLVLIDGIGGRALTDLEIRRQLKRLNKPAVKSFKGEGGDIIDCVDIYKQPAFDHPLLQNHTIQMRPSYYDSENKSSSKPIDQLWQPSESCPEGTIPIVRTQKSDLLRKISLEEDLRAPEMESAKLYLEDENVGGKGLINVWNINVEGNGESSTASIFVGIKDKPDFINAGWIVSPHRFGHNRTLLYVYWSSDNGGCFNLQCPGFVHTSRRYYLPSRIEPLSVYGGKQWHIHVNLHKDPKNDNWWFLFMDAPVGYWPSALFSIMKKTANIVQWGGQVWNSEPGGHHTTTQMGSGHFAKEKYYKAAYFDDCYYRDRNDESAGPYHSPLIATKPSCYDIARFGFEAVGFFFGGPGGVDCDK